MSHEDKPILIDLANFMNKAEIKRLDQNHPLQTDVLDTLASTTPKHLRKMYYN
jgi:hypothetical protein